MSMDIGTKIDNYIAGLLPWQRDIIARLRELIHRADPDVIEDWKWDRPAYSHNGLLCWTWAFEKWVSFTFFQGALIEDKFKLFNYGTFMDRNRTIAIRDVSEIQEEKLIAYIQEAVANNVAGKKIKTRTRRPKKQLPQKLKEALLKAELMERFGERPQYQQNDYISWITMAKRPETQEKRLEQMLDELARGDVYMNAPWSGRKK